MGIFALDFKSTRKRWSRNISMKCGARDIPHYYMRNRPYMFFSQKQNEKTKTKVNIKWCQSRRLSQAFKTFQGKGCPMWECQALKIWSKCGKGRRDRGLLNLESEGVGEAQGTALDGFGGGWVCDPAKLYQDSFYDSRDICLSPHLNMNFFQGRERGLHRGLTMCRDLW